MADFDLCVIGSGTGNSVITQRFADWKVALVDGQRRFGGTALNAGCIPTTMFGYSADLAEAARQAAGLGVHTGAVTVDWAAVRDRVFGRIDPLVESAQAYRRSQSTVTLLRGQGRFVGPKLLKVGDRTISADRFVIAAGSRPRIPEVSGIAEPAVAPRVHTTDTILRLPSLPKSLIILGGGTVAAEFAHIFAGFGTQVTVLHRGDRLLRAADGAISQRFTELLSRRVALRLGQHLSWIEATDRGVEVGTVDDDGIEYSFGAEQVLVATGRVSNADTLDCHRTGVEVDVETGRIVVDDQQRTTAADIYALGDISSEWPLRHVAAREADVVRHNLLHPTDPISIDYRFVPQAVFSGPSVAWVGLTEEQCRDQGRDYRLGVRDYGGVSYGWAMEDTDHVVKIIAERGTGKLLGGHILGPQAALLIQPIVQAMATGIDAATLARGQYWIHPGLAEVVEHALLDLDLDRED